MDIMNELPEAQFNDVDDLLAFISIYDDENRTRAYFSLIEKNADLIRDQVCVEAGCGFGIFAEKMAQLGAGKVYAVEANSHLYEIARSRLQHYKNIQVLHADIRDFQPPESVNLLVHELFGQLLFDEDIFVLDELAFRPHVILPNKAQLKMSVFSSKDYIDEIVSAHVLEKLKGALVSGLYEEDDSALKQTLLEWNPGKQDYQTIFDIKNAAGDLLCLGVEIHHNEQFVCRAGECDNWSRVWTPRAGDKFLLKFTPSARGAAVEFKWL